MYRDDQEALAARADAATREADRLRAENEAMRRAVAVRSDLAFTTLDMPPAVVYQSRDLRHLALSERARLANHQLRSFPVWATGILHVLTFGIFSFFHFGLMHDRLPRAAHNDPSAGKAIGFQFIPYFNLYWVFFNSLRFSDRLTLQYRVRGIDRSAPRGLALAASVTTVIPYINLLIGLPIMWLITACMLQSTVNDIATLSPNSWDASEAR